MFRAIRLLMGYSMLLVGGVFWFICFPLTAYTLYIARQFPFEYFGVEIPVPLPPLAAFIPKDIQPAIGGICLAFTAYGLFVIYIDVRKLRRLRQGQK